jgi:hypothetical protein
MNSEDKQQNIIRTLLKNEITWLLFIIAGVMGFVAQIILPLQRMSLQLTQIQMDLADTKKNYQTALMEHQDLRSRVDIIETKLNPLVNKTKQQ